MNCDIPPLVDCVTPASAPGLLFKLNDKFLRTLIVNCPGQDGCRGDDGEKGEKGEPGWSDGPIGETGKDGIAATTSLTLSGIDYNDIPGLTDKAIIDMHFLDSSTQGCQLAVTTGAVAKYGPASMVMATPIQRHIAYPSDPNTANCVITSLNNWALIKNAGDGTPTNLFLLRLSKDVSTGASSNSAGVNFNTYSIQAFVRDVVAAYTSELNALNMKWKVLVIDHITAIDDKARSIISGLANQLAMCEFNLPAYDYCITLVPCGVKPPTPTPPPPIKPPTPPPPAPPPPPSPAGAASGRASHAMRQALKQRQIMTLNMGNRTWRVNQ